MKPCGTSWNRRLADGRPEGACGRGQEDDCHVLRSSANERVVLVATEAPVGSRVDDLLFLHVVFTEHSLQIHSQVERPALSRKARSIRSMSLSISRCSLRMTDVGPVARITPRERLECSLLESVEPIVISCERLLHLALRPRLRSPARNLGSEARRTGLKGRPLENSLLFGLEATSTPRGSRSPTTTRDSPGARPSKTSRMSPSLSAA
jgi:hypothetical protein